MIEYKAKIYYNNDYLNYGRCFFIYLEYLGMFIYSIDEDFSYQVFQKPTEEINDIDLYTSSRNFNKILEFDGSKTIWIDDKENYPELDSILEKIKFKTKMSMLYNTIKDSSYVKIYGLLNIIQASL